MFAVGDEAPVLVSVDAPPELARPSDEDVAERMAAWRSDPRLVDVFSPAPFCRETCAGAPRSCAAARTLTTDRGVQRAFARIVLSLIEDPGALDRQWPDFLTVVRARRPAHLQESTLLRSLAGHLPELLAGRRGAQAGWSYEDTQTFSDRLRACIIEKLAGVGCEGVARQAFYAHARRLYERAYEPYPACATICDHATPPLCLYRHSLADLVTNDAYRTRWRNAEAQDVLREDKRRIGTWQACQDAGYEAIEWPEDDWPAAQRDRVAAAARRACLCYAQQMLAQEAKLPRSGRRILARILAEARP